jgi:hypothetical protein
MPQSEAAALANHTVPAPSPDYAVLQVVQGAGLKFASRRHTISYMERSNSVM